MHTSSITIWTQADLRCIEGWSEDNFALVRGIRLRKINDRTYLPKPRSHVFNIQYYTRSNVEISLTMTDSTDASLWACRLKRRFDQSTKDTQYEVKISCWPMKPCRLSYLDRMTEINVQWGIRSRWCPSTAVLSHRVSDDFRLSVRYFGDWFRLNET